ncbi:MAG: ribosome silencing factor [Desulfovibrio sp.]|nr:ribosome silencing factor [Desulfovibrio sp.]
MNGDASKAPEKAGLFLKPLDEAGATEPEILPLDKYAFADAIIVVTASSRRQARGIADAASRFCHENGFEVLGMEGYDAADWILVDCGDIIVNIFLEETRNLYKLEELWSRNRRLHDKETEE